MSEGKCHIVSTRLHENVVANFHNIFSKEKKPLRKVHLFPLIRILDNINGCIHFPEEILLHGTNWSAWHDSLMSPSYAYICNRRVFPEKHQLCDIYELQLHSIKIQGLKITLVIKKTNSILREMQYSFVILCALGAETQREQPCTPFPK